MPTSCEIYQTYLCGPAAVIRLFEQALGTRAIYGAPDPDMQPRTIESLSQDIGRLQSQLARLQEQLRETRSDNHRLRRRTAGRRPSRRSMCCRAIVARAGETGGWPSVPPRIVATLCAACICCAS
jgi:uncharacterized protein with von Willebrand factor type A (vWA) domain